MLTYEVTLEVDECWREALLDYMQQRHLPDIFDTGCFAAIHFETSEDGRIRTRYQALTQQDLDRYLDQYAMDMRADFLEHFPLGVSVNRTIWQQQLALTTRA